MEFALILPILLLLLLLAVDFGRVFFGWVALNNAARIAANEAGLHPEAWDGVPGGADAFLQASYRQQVVDDMQSINCEAPGGGGWATSDVPDPVFVDQPGSFSSDQYEIGDHAQVSLECEFGLLTPLVGQIVGDPLVIGARAEFPVRGGEVLGIPVAGGAAPTPTAGACSSSEAIVPNLIGQNLDAARAAWSAQFSGSFTPASGDGSHLVTGQTTSPAANPGECLDKTASVEVSHELPCTAPQLVGQKASAGQGDYTTAGFTGTYTITRPPANDYTIGSQSLVGGQPYLCSANMTVFK